MRNILIDCDPGHDDIMAILVALAHPKELKVLGFTTVCGNQTIDKVTDNLLKCLDYLQLSYPVAKGAEKPLVYEAEPQPMAHGESGLDGPNLPPATSTETLLDATRFIYQTLIDSSSKVTLVCLGPLTNIAHLLTEFPDSKDHIEEIVLMGGSIYSGNILPKAEFNIYHDPHAAEIVFASGVNVTMAGLEVCDSAFVWHYEMDTLQYRGKVSRLVYDLYMFFSQYSRKRNRENSPIFDVVPVMYLLEPELFSYEMYPVNVETEGKFCRGMTLCDLRLDRDHDLDRIKVLTKASRNQFVRYFLDSLSDMDQIIR